MTLKMSTNDFFYYFSTDKELGFILDGRLFGPFPSTPEFLYLLAQIIKKRFKNLTI